ncbi:hypothetical protein D3C81_1250900 [compost metagenome]
MPTNPVPIAADQALAFAKPGAFSEGLSQVFNWPDLGQPRGQVGVPLNFVEQAAGPAWTFLPRHQQTQLSLLQLGKIQAAEVLHQHGLQVSAQYGFHRQLPTRLHTQPLRQARPLLKALPAQPVGSTGAGFERGLLQCLQGCQTATQTLQVALLLLLSLGRLLQLRA